MLILPAITPPSRLLALLSRFAFLIGLCFVCVVVATAHVAIGRSRQLPARVAVRGVVRFRASGNMDDSLVPVTIEFGTATQRWQRVDGGKRVSILWTSSSGNADSAVGVVLRSPIDSLNSWIIELALPRTATSSLPVNTPVTVRATVKELELRDLIIQNLRSLLNR